MKIILVDAFGGPDVLQYVEAPDPTPGSGEVIVDVRAVGVGAADVALRTGHYPLAPHPPAQPGNEVAGVVSSLGEGVSGAWLGARVAIHMSTRGYAEKVVAPAGSLIRLPPELPFEVACAIPVTVQTAQRLLVDAGRLSAGRSVLIYGAAGALGSAAVALAHRIGAHVIAVASGRERAGWARAAGADIVIDRAAEPLGSAIHAAAPAGVDLILDPIGGPDMNERLGFLAPHGQLILYGLMAGPPPDLFQGLLANFLRSVSVQAFSLYSFAPEDRVALATSLAEQLASGDLSIADPMLLPLSQAAEAHRALEAGHAQRIVLIPGR